MVKLQTSGHLTDTWTNAHDILTGYVILYHHVMYEEKDSSRAGEIGLRADSHTVAETR